MNNTKKIEAIKRQLQYQARIRKQGDSFYAFVVYINQDGEEQVCADFKARFYTSYLRAEKATDNYITKVNP